MTLKLHSPLRVEEHKALAKLELKGSVLDLGGSKCSKYQKIFKGKYQITTVNIDKGAKPDIFHDLETLLPIESSSYKGVLMINVLEHIYAYRQLVEESFRVLENEGTVVCVVPFMFPEHSSPHDFHRFTDEALRKLFTDVGFINVEVKALGSGVFLTVLAFFDRLLPLPLRFVSSTIGIFLCKGADWALNNVARITGRQYDPTTYALGFVVKGKK